MTFDTAVSHIRQEYDRGERYIIVPDEVYYAYREGVPALNRVSLDPLLTYSDWGMYFKDAKVTTDSRGNR